MVEWRTLEDLRLLAGNRLAHGGAVLNSKRRALGDGRHGGDHAA